MSMYHIGIEETPAEVLADYLDHMGNGIYQTWNDFCDRTNNEEGFEDPYKTDYSCSEEEVWIIQDYYGSCGLETREDIETLEMLGYDLSDLTWLEEDEERLDEIYALIPEVSSFTLAMAEKEVV